MSEIEKETKNEVIFTNEQQLAKTIEGIKANGKEKFHVLTDFDRTLTSASKNGRTVPSVIAQLRNGEYLSKEYTEKAHALYDKYAPFERDSTVPLAERSRLMSEWWQAHFRLLVECGLDMKTMDQVAKNPEISLRNGVKEFLTKMHQDGIPVIIMSAGPGDMIIRHLQAEQSWFDNIHIIANFYDFDTENRVVGMKEPTIHSLNKYEIVVKNFPVFDLVKDRRNVLLMGDGVDDIGMINGFEATNLITVGFQNKNSDQEMSEFRDAFDIVIPNDGSFEAINDLYQKIFP